MEEPIILRRIIFRNKKQQVRFLTDAKKILDVSWENFAKPLGYNTRTVRDWAHGKYNMPYKIAQTLSKKTGVNLPHTIRTKNWDEHLHAISSKGGKSNIKKHGSIGGDEKYRKAQFIKWWNKTGKFKGQSILERKSIQYPKKDSQLAEFVGVMIGDGGISKFSTAITLNRVADKEYILFVSGLIKKLFGIDPKIYDRKVSLATDIIVHRRDLVDFCMSLGLPIGDKLKQGLDIPKWIQKNKSFSIACIRGLVDTDGSVFHHKYKVNGKQYCYTKISFTSCSPPLIQSVQRILVRYGFNARISYNGKEVRLESQKDVVKYRDLIGTSNLKHTRKFNA
ncbi:hypothetical protein COB55_05215 [Candidatus Wolfebacteria bacterium]|nr:MAG: hypothetical protein COB55_05215 [Candidatus Wolfebacteria bacterium]